MTFHPAKPNDHLFHRWVSTGGRWELGFWRVMFGVRVRLGLVGNGWCTLDLCAGADPEFQAELLRTVMAALIPFDEKSSERQIQDMIPAYSEIKPINLDPKAWPLLQNLARSALGIEVS
jgi:hypothetical protein